MIDRKITLETPRCLLRRFTADDIPFVFDASRHPGFCDGMRWDPPASEAEMYVPVERIELAWTEGRSFGFTIENKERREPVGRISIRRMEETSWDVGFWTHPSHQRRGYMGEALRAVLRFAFSDLGAEKVLAGHATWNHASRKVLEAAGFEFDRHEPKGFQKSGKWIAEDRLSITAERFAAIAPQKP